MPLGGCHLHYSPHILLISLVHLDSIDQLIDRSIDQLLLLLFECSNRNDVKQATAINDNNRVWLHADKNSRFCTVENHVAFVLKNLNYGFSLQKALTLDQA
jgi:hypothetical protein